jgi:hypothetical protein
MIKFKAKPIGVTASPVEAGKQVKALTTPAPGDQEPPFLIKDFPQNYITYHVHKATEKTRSPRPHNVVHASDLDPVRQWCPREPALLTHTGKSRPSEFVATAQRMTWGMGYKGADLLMDLIPAEMKWGNWKCRSCGHDHNLCYTPKACAGCGGSSKALRYVEVFLRDPDTELVGSVDLFVDILGNGIKTPVEIKTEGNDGFKKRTKPEFDHEWRTMLYLWLIERTPQLKGLGLNHQEGRVIYFTKEGWADAPKIKEWKLADRAASAIKEYFVNRNDDMTLNAREQVAAYREWRKIHDAGLVGSLVNPLPARVCSSPSETRAKNCAVCKECFAT